MTSDGSLAGRIRLRASDLSERTTQRGRRSLRESWGRWRNRWFLITQCAVTAGLAWWLAQVILRHPLPLFAPIAAVLCLNVTFGDRLRRGVEVAIGAAVGVGVGDVFTHLFGTGGWQIVLIVGLAMSVATLVGAGQLMIIQAAVQSIVVTALLPSPGEGLGRWLDAVLGCVIALTVATVAPSSPLRRPGILAAEVLQDIAGTLDAAAAALREQDTAAADAVLERARRGSAALKALQDAADEGMAIIRHSPFRRRQAAGVRALAEVVGPLTRANRNLRVLARRGVVALWRNESVPDAYLDEMRTVADVARSMAGELYERRIPVSARPRLQAAAEQSAQLPAYDSLSAAVILAQTRAMIIDLLELTGLEYTDARSLMPGD